MRLIFPALLLGLTICSASACARPPVFARPSVAVPERPAMLPVRWRHAEGLHCLTGEDAQALLINISRQEAHMDILEGCLRAVNGGVQ